MSIIIRDNNILLLQAMLMGAFFSLQLIILLATFFIGSLIVPHYVSAIIVLPALILIPIAKILALILGGFALPAVGIGALWAKINDKPVVKGVLIALLSLLIGGIIFGVVLKISSPDRPLF